MNDDDLYDMLNGVSFNGSSFPSTYVKLLKSMGISIDGFDTLNEQFEKDKKVSKTKKKEEPPKTELEEVRAAFAVLNRENMQVKEEIENLKDKYLKLSCSKDKKEEKLEKRIIILQKELEKALKYIAVLEQNMV